MSRILIAEYNLANRELLREILEIHGYQVIEAFDGQEVASTSWTFTVKLAGVCGLAKWRPSCEAGLTVWLMRAESTALSFLSQLH